MKVYYNLDELPHLTNTVITIGSFDGVHSGHQKIIQRLTNISQEHGVDNVVITFHPHPRSIVYPKDKSLKLLSSLQEKIDLFENYGINYLVIVPFTIEFSQISAQEYIEKFLVEKFNPRYIVIGYDHRFGLNRTGNLQLLANNKEKYGYDIIEIDKQEIENITISSTQIRESILRGDLATANSLLNHPFQLSGTVIKGRKLGTEIGFPTANLKIEHPQKIIPKDGIYTCQVIVRKKRYNGMLYIGDIPTIGTDNPKSIEVNIFDFEEDIYDERISIHVLEYLRGDQKFDSLNELKVQLGKDRDATLALFGKQVQPEKAKTTIAILNYNTQSYLESFLPGLSYSSQHHMDVLLIDNASQDASVSYVQEWFPEVKVLQLSENYGFAEGYNKGLSGVETEYIALVNSDVKVTESWLDPLVSYLDDHPQVAAVMPKILSFNDPDSYEYAGAAGGYMDYLAYPFCRGRIFNNVEKDEGQYNDTSDIFWVSGAACVIRKDIFFDLGGFDGDYFAHQEEIDLCWRIHRSGYDIKVVPQSIVYHVGGGSLDYSSPRKVFLNFRNSLYTIFKNESLLNLLWKLPVRYVLDWVASFKYLISGNFGFGIAVIKAQLAFIVYIPKLITKRKKYNEKVQTAAKSNEAKKGYLYQKSIVLQYYIFGNKRFSDLS